MSSTDNTVGSSGENIAKKEAALRAVITIEALNTMCLEKNCVNLKLEMCKHRENALNGIIDLASKGFTVVGMHCNLREPLDKLDSGLWDCICTHCVEHMNTILKHDCEYRKPAEKVLESLAKQGIAINDMYCQINTFRKF